MTGQSEGGDRGPPPGRLGATWEPGLPPVGALTRGQRVYVLRAARRAWERGLPGTARDILRRYDLESYWPTFQQQALTTARDRFNQAMSRYTQ